MVTDRFGMGKVITFAATIQAACYCVIIAPPPFPVLPVTYMFIGEPNDARVL